MNSIEYYLEPSKEGYHTLRVKSEDNSFRYIHSKYYPSKESSYLQDIVNPEKYDVCIILGIGLGYHLAYLHQVIHLFKQIICIDIHNYLPNATISPEIQSIIENPSIQLVYVNHDTISMLHDVIKFNFTKGIQVIEHPASINAFPSLFSSIKRSLQQIIEKSVTNHLTSSMFAYRYIKNALINLSRLPECFSVQQCKDVHKDKPCIIVAPGPSFDAIAEHLATMQHHVIIIAVDSALKALHAYSIIPDYIVSIDPQPVVFAHFFSTHTNSYIISTPTAHPMIFSSPVILSLNTHPLCQLIDELYPDHIGSVDSRTGTVLGDAISFALFAGCNPLAITGADFSFPRFITYARTTEYQYRYQCMHSRITPLETKNMDYIIYASRRTLTHSTYSRKVFIQYRNAINNLLPKNVHIFHLHPQLPLENARPLTIKNFLSLPQVIHHKKEIPLPLQKLSGTINIHTVYAMLQDETIFSSILEASHIRSLIDIQKIHHLLLKGANL
ncbi:MAG: DUF115 domain-containing protein [Spirochaetes bacterium]|nr:DUF115 domain-containing protein [Spirochaetota bacterium]